MRYGHRYWPVMAVLLSVGMCACGSAKQESRPTTQSNGTPVSHTSSTDAPQSAASEREPIQDVDGDREGAYTVKPLPGGHYDDDDITSLHFGHPASISDRRAVVTLVGRYNTAVAKIDGVSACGLLYTGLKEGVIEDFHHPLGGRKKTCLIVVRWLYRFAHKRKVIDANKTLRVMQVLVRRSEALVLMGAGRVVEHTLMVRRERGRWKIAEMYVEPLA
jgi:hypothetical protein